MAQSKNFFGLRKGSTKNFTFSTLEGKQITKERVSEVKNPQTAGQMRQRMVMTTVGAAYKFLKAIADHSFEGKTAGMACMREFNSRNINKFKVAAGLNGNVPYNQFKDGDINPLPFVLAAGSLDALNYSFDAEKKIQLAFTSANADLTTAEGIYSLMGVQKGDLITFCTVVGDKSIDNGVYNYKAKAFNIVRLYCDQTGDVDDVKDAFTISTSNANASVEFVKATNSLTIKSTVADFGAVIQSRKNDNSWLRSNAVMIVAGGVTDGASTASQFATYPIGTDLILNNGPMNVTSSGSASGTPSGPSLQTPSLAFANASASIAKGNTAAGPKLNGVPSGATVTYKSSAENIAKVNASTGNVTAVAEGKATITATTTATSEYKAGSASYSLTVTASGSGVSGDGGMNLD